MISAFRRTEVRIPVGDGVHTAVTVVSPQIPDGTVLFAFPGGGYNRRYYDLPIPGGYSQAAFHASRGWTVVCCDHIGVGDSSPPRPDEWKFADIADANQATVVAVLERLQLSGPALGAGQSMGGLSPARPTGPPSHFRRHCSAWLQRSPYCAADARGRIRHARGAFAGGRRR
jgi:predicted alpha/beta hydrolase